MTTVKWIGVIAGLVLTGVLVTVLTACPCSRIPGMWLSGDEVAAPDSWEFANSAPLCQLEVSTWYTRSINLNCMSAQGDLYVSCSRCEGKQWSTQALINQNARIRINGTVYPVKLRRVTQASELDRAWLARSNKFGRDPDSPRPDHWWSFHLSDRSG